MTDWQVSSRHAANLDLAHRIFKLDAVACRVSGVFNTGVFIHVAAAGFVDGLLESVDEVLTGVVDAQPDGAHGA